MVLTDAEVAKRAAMAGATVIRSLTGQNVERIDKGANDFATEADIASEKAIIGVIRQERPDDTIIGEESGLNTSLAGSPSGRVWLVDPLCGTINYVIQARDVAVNVALIDREDQDIAAAVADPFSDELFWTDGSRAYVSKGGMDTELAPSELLSPRLVEINFNAPIGKGTQLATAPMFRERFSMRVLSTTLCVPWVAAGRRTAYVSDGYLKNNVHYAAGIAICKAAGCIVTGIQGQPLHTGPGGLLIATDDKTHSLLVEIIRTI